MRIRIQKINEGVTFTPVTKSGRPLGGAMGATARRAIRDAEAWYRVQVVLSFVNEGVERTGYAHNFERTYAVVPDARGRSAAREGAYLRLEPVGFAHPDEQGGWWMNDSGSTPTSGRARVLACYQAPLWRVPDAPGLVRFERFVDVTTTRVVPEGRPKIACSCRCPRVRDEHDRCSRCGGVVSESVSCAVEA